MYLDESKWEYWFNLSVWTQLEAALILDGIIPKPETLRTIFEHDGFCLEPNTESIFKFIKREISKDKKMSPREYLEWAIQKNISLPVELTDAINKSQFKIRCENEPQLKTSKMTGTHWGEKRADVLGIALSFINNPPSSYSREEFFHKDGTIHINKIAEAIDDHRAVFWGDEKGMKMDNIRVTLSNAINQRDKK